MIRTNCKLFYNFKEPVHLARECRGGGPVADRVGEAGGGKFGLNSPTAKFSHGYVLPRLNSPTAWEKRGLQLRRCTQGWQSRADPRIRDLGLADSAEMSDLATRRLRPRPSRDPRAGA